MFVFNRNKYLKLELIFFGVYFYLFKFLTDFEYNYWERKITGISGFAVEYNLLHGTTSMFAFWIFYQLVRRYLVDKRTGKFILMIVIFLISYSLYSKLVNYLFANLEFLSDEMRSNAKRVFNFKSIGYSFPFMARELLSMSCLAYFIHVDQQNEQMKVLKEQQLLSELTYLKAQLQPHFFFNTLNNIYGLALQQSKSTAPLIAKLAEMMRYILYHTEKKLLPLSDEINFIENYVEVERVRYREAIHISFDKQLSGDAIQISPLLLLPFVENAFKHGIQEEQREGFVKILILQTEHELVMEVSNSIAAKKNQVGGIGLINVKKRLDILYPNQYKLDFRDEKNIYKVNLTIKI